MPHPPPVFQVGKKPSPNRVKIFKERLILILIFKLFHSIVPVYLAVLLPYLVRCDIDIRNIHITF